MNTEGGTGTEGKGSSNIQLTRRDTKASNKRRQQNSDRVHRIKTNPRGHRPMKATHVSFLIACCLISVYAQRPTVTPDRHIIFAVLNNGSTLEPIGYLEDKKLDDAIDGASEADVLASFHKRYFKPKTSYQLIFGGANAGLAAVKSSDPNQECERHTARAVVSSTKARLKGNVMALAVSSTYKPAGSGTRRPPTPLERTEIESLVRAELVKNKVAAAVARKLRYQNLTAIDVDKDDDVEFIGSYWVQPTLKTRSLLFFIAEKGIDGRYKLVTKEFASMKEEDTMSNDITAVDTGIGHELLLDTLDIDGDGTSEIFTYQASFEGAGFNVYRRERGNWTRIFETSNYRCAF